MNPAIFVGVIAGLIAASRRGATSGNHGESSVVIAMMIWFLLVPVWIAELALAIGHFADGNWGAAAISSLVFVVLTFVLFPWPISRAWLIPAGHPRLAWALTRLSFWVWRRDVRGGALIAAAWANARRAQRGDAVSAESLAWIESRLVEAPGDQLRWKLGGAGLVAAGFLVEARGDRGQARRLLASVGELAAPTWPPMAVVLAWEWLCAEAMTRGAWREVELLARTAPIESRTLNFLASVSARLTGIAPLPNDLVLQSRWVFTPRRMALRPLLRRALAAPDKPREPKSREAPLDEPTLPEGPPLLVAMTLHAHMLSRDPSQLSRAHVTRLAQLWDAALADPGLDRKLVARGEQLGANASTTAGSNLALADSVREDLLGLIQSAGLELGQLGDDSELLGRAARLLHTELLDSLEIATGALESRVQSKRALPAIDEWRSFLAIREQYGEAVALGGLPLRRLAFSTVHGPVCSLAVWLWNERNERAIANGMFSWLLSEAIIVDDAAAIRLQEKNVNCGV